jgi:hypothetical protein
MFNDDEIDEVFLEFRRLTRRLGGLSTPIIRDIIKSIKRATNEIRRSHWRAEDAQASIPLLKILSTMIAIVESEETKPLLKRLPRIQRRKRTIGRSKIKIYQVCVVKNGDQIKSREEEYT